MNAEDITVGMTVSYTKKDGDTITAEVSKGPVEMKHGLVVVFLKGIRGFVDIKRISAAA
jgi:endonuclease V-like protein UPF0215 family